MVYVGLYDGSGSSVHALNASTGTTLWSYTTGAPVYSSPTILGFIENNFNLGIGNINAQNHYPFGDNFAPDYNSQLGNTHLPTSSRSPRRASSSRSMCRRRGKASTLTISLTTLAQFWTPTTMRLTTIRGKP